MKCNPNTVRSFILSSYIMVSNRWFKGTHTLNMSIIARFIMQQVIDKAHLRSFIDKNFIGRIIQKR